MITVSGVQKVRVPKNEDDAVKILTTPQLLEYHPERHEWLDALQEGGRFPGMGLMLLDVGKMVVHPDVFTPYNYFKAGISNCKFKVRAGSQDQATFVHNLFTRVWKNDLDSLQLSYDYGWLGSEVLYRLKKGYLYYDTVANAHPLDCWALTHKGRYVGFSVTSSTGSIKNSSYEIDKALWGPYTALPPKGLWIVHNKRWDRYYGISQLYPAWIPYRRLASRNGAIEVVDGGIYRLAYQGPIVRYPPEDFVRPGGGDEASDRDQSRRLASQMGEKVKAGASYALPNTRDQQGNYKWDISFPSAQGVLNVEPLLSYETHLCKQISRGVGVPPELIEAGESGSGWSGRKIPLLGFFQAQVRIARALVKQIVRQIALPLLKFNYGGSAWCEVEVELDLPAAVSGEQQQPAAPGQQAPMPAEPGTSETMQGQGQTPGEEESVGGLVEALNKSDEATLSLVEEEQWLPWKVKHGPREGQQGWKNAITGHIVVGDKPGMKQAKQFQPPPVAFETPVPRLKERAAPAARPFRPGR